ncbi:Low-density lipoprotein (LDL) receptor class A repeat [Trinorchestia longiramus]|nr:Low-density lipoprotein (LDL) receptor class A repeat [Trinorchestia longiramus]
MTSQRLLPQCRESLRGSEKEEVNCKELQLLVSTTHHSRRNTAGQHEPCCICATLRQRFCWRCLSKTVSVSSNNQAIKAFFFQPNNVPSNESRAWQILDGGDQGPLHSFSVTFWLKVHYFRDSTYCLSYAIDDERNNELNFAIRDNFFLAYVNAKSFTTIRGELVLPGRWYHLALVQNYRELFFYVDGKLKSKKKKRSATLHLNGSLVLGQETDIFNGDFNDAQSFSGLIADFNFFSRALNESEVAEFVKCNKSDSLVGDITNLDTEWNTEGAVNELDIPFEDICQQETLMQIFPEPFTVDEAFGLCSKLKADLLAPTTEAENIKAYDLVEQYAVKCQPKNHGSSFMWLGFTDGAEEGNWTDYHGNHLNYTNFINNGVTKSQDCAAYEKPPDNYKWNDMTCGKTYNLCVSCTASSYPVLHLRGLCEEKEKDVRFLIGPDMVDYKHSFRGFSKYSLKLQKNMDEKEVWVLQNMWEANQTVASWYSYNNAYPFGVRSWTVEEDYKICEKPKGDTMWLSFCACYEDEFCCDDGSCIALRDRCNLRTDCADASDEAQCQKILRTSDYFAALPPPGVNGEPLKVNITINIRSFSEIDIRNMMIKVDLEVTTSWLDSRLTFKNLRSLQDINHVNFNEVWSPQFDLLNADFPHVYRTVPRVTVKKNAEPLPDDLSRYVHDEIFDGQNNPLQLTQKVNAPFSCDMDLKNFPFDIQYCKLLFQLSSVGSDFSVWNSVQVHYDGERLLTEYEVGNLRTSEKTMNEHSVAVVLIPLYGRFWFHVTSSYLPILMLIIISYASLFCRYENTDLRIMMALTALLVLYALYQQISEGLPKTSYTEAVDVWCFFAITLIFSNTARSNRLLDLAPHVYVAAQHRGYRKGCRSEAKKTPEAGRSKTALHVPDHLLHRVPGVLGHLLECGSYEQNRARTKRIGYLNVLKIYRRIYGTSVISWDGGRFVSC